MLLAFRGLAHGPQGVLAAVYGLALVSIKLCLNIISGPKREAGLEPGITQFANSDCWGRRFLYDPQASTSHDRSLPHSAGVVCPVVFKRHHYRAAGLLSLFVSPP
jgi:hypothetical protein